MFKATVSKVKISEFDMFDSMSSKQGINKFEITIQQMRRFDKVDFICSNNEEV